MSSPDRRRGGLSSSLRRGAGTAAALLLLAGMSSPQAQTVVPNAHLDTALTPWASFVSAAPDPAGSGNAPLWQAAPDVDGNPASGSSLIHIATTVPAANAASGIAQCFDFAGGPAPVSFVNYGMAFRLPAGTPADGAVAATVEVRLFSAAGCNGFIAGGTQGQSLSAPGVVAGSWNRLADSGFVPPGAPVTAASVQIRGYLRQTGAPASQAGYAVDLDHFLLVLNSTTPVELLQFSVD
ncbi:hypothetical protein [Tahibacter harae]|uniref:Uncharacterized protein n=1 Tax=Tahibacter harae TaxID=2963937 RepID=A0ABT1QM93_9GAMM|nr:hypothetical protein [Tahibacter harae]MCQ4163572.1 hypothetical protein [Tahibacter harae]